MRQLKNAQKHLNSTQHTWKPCFGEQKRMKSLNTMMKLLPVRCFLLCVFMCQLHITAFHISMHHRWSSLLLIAVNWSLLIDMKKVIEVDPSNQQATRSLFRLEPLAAEKREKMKEEMIGNVLPFFQVSQTALLALCDPIVESCRYLFCKMAFLAKHVCFREHLVMKCEVLRS